MLEAMLDREARDAGCPSAPDNLAANFGSRILDDAAIAGMHATALDLSAAMRNPLQLPRGQGGAATAARPPSSAAIRRGGDSGSASPGRTRFAGAGSGDGGAGADVDGDGADDEPHLRPHDFEHGLAESYNAYRRACEHDRAEMDRASASGKQPSPEKGAGAAAGGQTGALHSPQSARIRSELQHSGHNRRRSLGGGEARAFSAAGQGGLDSQWPSETQRSSHSGVLPATERRPVPEMFPAGRIMHLVPVDMLPAAARDMLPRRAAAHKHSATAPGGAPPPAPHALLHCSESADAAAALLTDDRAAADSEHEAGVVPVGGVVAPPRHVVLVDQAPYDAYKRIVLCQTMLADHFLSKYILSMDALLAGLDDGESAAFAEAAD